MEPPPQTPPPGPLSYFSPPPLSQPNNFKNRTNRSPSPLSPSQIHPLDQYGTLTITTPNQPPPPSPYSSRSIDLSPIEFVLALMAVIIIPAIIYATFFAIKCPPWSSSRHRRPSSGELPRNNPETSVEVTESRKETVSSLKYQKETHAKDIGTECPVCLSAFADGEEVKQLKECKHSFHATCIDLWLNNHNNCPICRAFVSGNRPNSKTNNNNLRAPSRSARDHFSDLHQGLPDAASLV